MGLDMYAYRVAKENAIGDFEVAKDEEGNSIIEDNNFAYWRKFNAFHGWMEQLYYAKGGTKESFNCVPVRLTLEDLDKLQKDVINGALKPTSGFFFGEEVIYPGDIESLYAFIGKAVVAIKEGDAVYYDSWW